MSELTQPPFDTRENEEDSLRSRLATLLAQVQTAEADRDLAVERAEKAEAENTRLRYCETCDLTMGPTCFGLRCDECYCAAVRRAEKAEAELETIRRENREIAEY